MINPQLNEVESAGIVSRIDPILMDILVYMTERAPDVVSADELLDRFWHGRVVEESTIHRRISQLRSALGDSARNSKYVATIPKRGYRLVAEVGTLDAESAKTDQPSLSIEEPTDSKPRRNRVYLMAGLVLMVIAAVLYTAVNYEMQSDPASWPNSEEPLKLAVLPFQDFSDPPNNSHLAAGFQEDILTKLARLETIQVTSRTSTRRYQDENTRAIPEIASELGVTHIIEGSIRRVNERVRITVQLIDALSDNHIWAQSYDRDIADIFSVQSEIAKEVASRLVDGFSEEETLLFEGVPTDDLQAYELVLKGREQIDIGTVESLTIAAHLMKTAIEQDALLAEAHSGYSRALFLQTFLGVPWKDVRARVLEASELALELDPGSAPINANYAHIQSGWVGNEQLGLKHYEKALQLAPNNSFVLLHYGAHLSLHLGEYERGLPLLERALKLNPLSGEVSFYLGRTLEELGFQEQAYAVAVQGLKYDPDDIDVRSLEINLLFSRGDVFQALSRTHAQVQLDPQNIGLLLGPVAPLLFMDELDAAQLWIDRMEVLSPTHPYYFYHQMYLYLMRGDIEGMEKLYGKWQTMNTNSQMSSANTDGSFGDMARVLLLSQKADRAHRQQQGDVASALRSQAVELSSLLFWDDEENMTVEISNQGVAFTHAVNLKLLGREEEATLVLGELVKTGNPHDLWQLTIVFLSHILLGQHEQAMTLVESRPNHLYLKTLLKTVKDNEFGLYDNFLHESAFTEFYDRVKISNAALKQRLVEEMPDFLTAETD